MNASSCVATGCTNQNNLLGRIMNCPSGPPTTFPPGWTVFETWTVQNCVGDPYQMIALPADACSGLWGGSTIKLECSTSKVYDCGTSIQTCAWCANKTAATNVCANGNPTTTFGMQSYRWRCSGVPTFASTTATSTTSSPTSSPSGGSSTTCFHESTRITYKEKNNQQLTLAQLQTFKDCRVPHVIRLSDGVQIETTCNTGNAPLRLTGDHLVFTARGLVAAASLVANRDILFADLDQKQECRVTRVTPEMTPQTYFGLNCLESQVLANGLKTSTFDHYHTIPAIWMSWLGSALGLERASRWGDTMATLAKKMKLL